MKITEKLYIERLEKMVKLYKKDPCSHCPMQIYYARWKTMLGYSFKESMSFNGEYVHCEICRRLTAKYVEFENKEKLNRRWCPCSFFGHFVLKLKEDEEMPGGYMTKIAWQVIKGWKKDNEKKKELNGN